MKTKFCTIFLLSLAFLNANAADSTAAPTGIPLLSLSVAPAVADPYSKSGKAGPISVQVDDANPGITIHTDGLFGADLAVWNPPDRYWDAKPYLMEAGFNWFRFPDGSLSNEYHWNGKGKYDSTGIWHSDPKGWSPGFVAESKWRGTSKDNYGFRRPAFQLDGDTSTMWWGVVYDSKDPPWFMIDLGDTSEVDSILIDWGSKRPKSFQLMTWDTSFANYPGPHQANQNRWISALGTTEKLTVNAASTSQKFASKVGRYWSVRFALSDLGPEGVQVREFRLYRKGELITRNAPKPTEQPKTWSMGTRSGDIARTDWVNIKWHFESFMEFVNSVPGGRAVICVNLGLGTPEEGAEWVRYANKVKGYKIRDWQLGNENDGDWEEAGPLSSLQYTAKFLAFTKAMKAVDPTIRIHGPLHSSDEVFLRGDGVYSGQSWLQTFLKTVAAAERKDKKRYLDAMDFHTYPYWSNDSVSAFRMLAASARPGPNMDTLLSWMDQYLQDGKSRQVHMSEFSSTVIGTDKSLHAVQASVVNHIFAQFLVRAGNRGHVLPWDVYGGWQTGKDGTQGSIRLFNPATPKGYSSWDKSDPSSQWFGLHLAFQHWVREGLRVLPTTTADSAVRAFSLGKGDTTHVLLFNMSEHSMPVQISRKSQVSTPAQVFHFSAQNFQWIGSDDKAYAKPGMGPWANRFGATQSISIQIPPMGMALVNWDPKPLQSNEVEALHLGSNAKVLMPGDTFEFWGTLRQKGGSLLGGKFNCAPFAQGPLIFADNMSGGEMEGVYFRIPIPANTKPSTYSLKLEVEGTGQQGLAERIQFRVRGLFRTVLALINFDVVTPDSFGNGDNATVITPVVKHGPAPLLSWLQAKFFIEQPKGQNWPNFVSMRFYLDRKVINGVGIPGVPDSTRIAGIVFDYATRHSTAEGYFELQVLTDTVTDYDEFQLRLRKTGGSWVRDTVLWNQTKQEGWGKPVGQIDGAKIKALEFRARGEGSGEIDLNNIMLLAENGKEIPMPTELRRLR